MEVFGSANLRSREAGREHAIPYEIVLASINNDLRITSATSGLQLVAMAPWYRLSGDIDALLVVGGISIWTGESLLARPAELTGEPKEPFAGRKLDVTVNWPVQSYKAAVVGE